MVYNYFRDYSPEIGRYIESDPIGLGGGLNTFVYVHEPISAIDPLGLMGGRSGGRPSRPILSPKSPSTNASPVNLTCSGTWRVYKFNRGTTPNPRIPMSQAGQPVRSTFPSLSCTCYWLCEDCNSPSIFSASGDGLPTTTGTAFFNPNGPQGQAGSIESGNDCICDPPGSETGCTTCPKPTKTK